MQLRLAPAEATTSAELRPLLPAPEEVHLQHESEQLMPQRQMTCPRCWGSRHEPGIDSITDAVCSYCSGAGAVPDQALSPNFMLSELLVSEAAARLRLPNDPPEGYLDRLRQVAAELLEPLRARFGPIHINSGYRAPSVNAAIGGSATSAHLQGWAADLVPLVTGVTLKAIVDWLIASGPDFDQVIREGSWVHVGRFGPAGVVRRQALQMYGGHYQPYDSEDPRNG